MPTPITPREHRAQEFGRRTAEVAIAQLRTAWTSTRLNGTDGDEQEAAEVADARAWGILAGAVLREAGYVDSERTT